MREIALTRGKVTQIDDADFDWLNQWKWFAAKRKKQWYAARGVWNPAKKNNDVVCMHNMLLPGVPLVDHRDRDGLNNQRHNLRPATKALNAINTGLQSNNTSGVRGVYFNRQRRKWQAQIGVDGTIRPLGRFLTLPEAIEARKAAERQFHNL